MTARARRSAKPAEIGHHLESLEIKDFKSLKAVRVELGQINTFVGANGSGKSNLLEAIGILGAAASGIIDDQALLRRGVRPGVPALYKSSFQGMKKEPRISLRVRSRAEVEYHAYITNPSEPSQWVFSNETLKLGGAIIASRGPKGEANALDRRIPLENRRSVLTLVRASAETPAEVRSFLDALEDFAIFSPVTPVLRGIAPDTAQRAPVGLFGGQLPEAVELIRSQAGHDRAVREVLEEFLELVDWAARVDVGPPSHKILSASVPTTRQVLHFRDRYMDSKRNTLSGYDASEGALYVLFLLVLAVHARSPSCLAVDNFDQALNPRTARALTLRFVTAILAQQRQVFLTTHNPLVLDGLPLWDERVRLFTVDRDQSGKTDVHRVKVPDAARVRAAHEEMALGRQWVMGRLGGVPNV